MLLLTDNYTRGIYSQPSTVASVDSLTLAAVLLLLVILGFSARPVGRLLRRLIADLFLVRQRRNNFEEHVASESRAMMLMMLITTVLEGVFLTAFYGNGQLMSVGMSFAFYTFVAALFNVFSIVACSTLGFTFTNITGALQLRRGLYASQALLGLILVIPAVVLLVHPDAAIPTSTMAVISYILMRVAYISKGLRIFYSGFYSFLYFILYLCTLEIIPLLVVHRWILSLN